jgi:hypothetical protein
MATIIQSDENTFIANNGKGTELRLTKRAAGYWEVWAMNASVSAWRTPGVKIFWHLSDIEKSYKTFRGISALIQ